VSWWSRFLAAFEAAKAVLIAVTCNVPLEHSALFPHIRAESTPLSLVPRFDPKFLQNRPMFLSGSTLIVALLAAAGAQAQDARSENPSRRGAQTAELELDAIKVIGKGERPGVGPNLETPSKAGSRLELTPLETPASVEIIGGDIIRDRGQTDVNQAIVRNGIGITFLGAPGNGGTSLGMRGFTGLGAVARLYDGTRIYPASGTITFPFDSWTVDRIEILHGPASVLYGEGAIGGAVNVIPKKPMTEGRRNEIMATVGTDGRKGMAFGSAGPISDRLAYSFDISIRDTEGWLERGDASSLAFSGSALWQVSDDLSLTFSHDYGYAEPTGYFGTPLVAGRLDERLRKANYNISDALNRFQDNFTQVRAEWTPTGNFALRSTAYRVSSDRQWRNVETYRHRAATDDVLRSDYIAIGHEYEQYGNRTDISFDSTIAGMDNDTVVGFDVNRISFANTNNSPYPGQSTVPGLDFDPGHFIGPDKFVTTNRSTVWQYSLFADNRLAVTDRWSLVGGLRYDSPHVNRTDPQTGTGFERSYDSLNWRIGTVYNPLPDMALYAQYSRASEPIGNLLSLSEAQKDYALPQGEQYEVGIKYAFPNGRVEATLSAYRIVKTNVLARDPDNPPVIRQIGRQSSRGIEAAISWELGGGWRIDANGTILQAEYDNYIQAGGDFSGKTLPNVPRHAANIYTSWAFAENWTALGGIHYVGETYTNDANTSTRPAYAVVNAGLQWRPNEKTTLDLFVENLFDEAYATSGNSTQWLLGAPRSASLSLRLAF
jgi:iron complex outermembrane receptor protein